MMPSDKKRINLTVPDDVYTLLQEYKREACVSNDATACLQLIVLQLKAQKKSKIAMSVFANLSPEQLQQAFNEGVSFIKEASSFSSRAIRRNVRGVNNL